MSERRARVELACMMILQPPLERARLSWLHQCCTAYDSEPADFSGRGGHADRWESAADSYFNLGFRYASFESRTSEARLRLSTLAVHGRVELAALAVRMSAWPVGV